MYNMHIMCIILKGDLKVKYKAKNTNYRFLIVS